MAKIDFKARFKDIMIGEAARDRRLRGTLEWLLLGETDKVSDGFLNNVDEAEVVADVAEKYNLSPEEVRIACNICEEQIMGGDHMNSN